MVSVKAYDHIIDFIVTGMEAEQIVAFRPPAKSIERFESLILKEKNAALTEEEKSELDHYLFVEHIMRLAKTKARKSLRA